MIVWATGASKQDGDAVPGAAGDLGGGHPEFSHNETGRVPQVVRAAAQRRPVPGGGQGLLAARCFRPRSCLAVP